MTFSLPGLEPYQELVRDFIVDTPKAGVFLTLGGGKTLVTLSALAQIRPSGHILVVAPVAIARSTWINEIEKWGFPLRTRSLIVNDNDKKFTKDKRLSRYAEIFTDRPTMYFINRELFADLVEAMPLRRVGGVREIQWPFPTLVIDESQGFKNPSGNRFKAARKIHAATTRVIELSGTPTPQGLLDLWAQVYLLDGGLALGPAFGRYRDRWFDAAAHVNNRPVSWKPRHGAREDIYARIRHLVMSAENTEVPLPEVCVDDVSVTMPQAARKRYKKFKRDLIIEFASRDPADASTIMITADNAAILNAKLVQFASGTMYLGENHDRDYAVMHTEKLEMTDYLIRNSAASPVIVAYRFRADKAELMKHLAKAGHAVEVLDGSRAMIARWNCGAIPVMLLHPASAGHGLNLQDGGHTLLWYSLPDSLEHYLQTNARLVRIGQNHPVQIWRLVAKDTNDEMQPRRLARKATDQQSLLDAVRRDVELFVSRNDMEDILGDLDINPL